MCTMHEQEMSSEQKVHCQTVTATRVQYIPVLVVSFRGVVCLIISVQPCLQYERELKRSPPQDDVLDGTLRFKRRREDQREVGHRALLLVIPRKVFKEPRGCSQ